jgi:CCR4-NOT transcription complex subunit 4
MTRKTLSAEKAAERLKALQEKNAAKIAERNRLLAEKAGEKKKAVDKAQFEKLLRDREKERLEKESEKIRLAAEREKSDKAEKERIAEKEKTKKGKQHAKPSGPTASSKAPVSSVVPEPVTQVPLLSKKPKKNKPAAKPIRIPKEEEAVADEALPPPVSVPDPPPSVTKATADSSSANSRSQSLDRNSPLERTSLEEMLEEINIQNPSMDLPNHPFFDMQKINPAGKMPLEYGPLVHALSALSIGGTSFTNNVPSGSIDNAVSSFQQLLETLTQTISDLLRLLPRTTWDDSSSFDGVLREMLKGDDFLDDGGEEMHQKDDEVAALTLALERRARWMEVQLSKLEELHRDINTAAVRAVLAINDAGWDRHMSLPRVGNTLRRFDSIGMKTDASGELRPMTIEELAKKLAVAREAASFAEMEVKEIMEKMQAIRPVAVES